MIFNRFLICVVLCFVSICYADKPYFNVIEMSKLYSILYDMNTLSRSLLESEDYHLDQMQEDFFKKIYEDTKYFAEFLLEPPNIQHEITRGFAKNYLSRPDNLLKWKQRQLLFTETAKNYYQYKLDDEDNNLLDYLYDIFKPLSQQGKKIHYDREFDPSGEKLKQLIFGKDLSNSSEERHINPKHFGKRHRYVKPHSYYGAYP